MKEVFLLNYRQWNNYENSLTILELLFSVNNPSFQLKTDEVYEVIKFIINSNEKIKSRILLQIYKILHLKKIEVAQIENIKYKKYQYRYCKNI